MDDLISRQAVIEINRSYHGQMPNEVNHRIWKEINELPSAQADSKETSSTHKALDTISRQAAIDAVKWGITYARAINTCTGETKELFKVSNHALNEAVERLKELPSAQPERTCVNCGRTVNNGGWYADGGTRCPIEEHYALPKDGYCHLWEKRNVTDDDYPERREE